MEKNDNDTKTSESLGVCEKLFTALKVFPAFKTIRRISYRPIRDPTPTDNGDHRRVIEIKTKSLSASDRQPQETGKTADHVQAVPINYVSTGTATTNTNNVAVEKALSKQNDVVSLHDKRKPEAEIISSQRKTKPESSSTTTDHRDPINATFTEYINRVGSRFRKTPESDGGDHQKKSSAGADNHGGIIKKKGSFKDHFSDYIHRTKVKIASPARSAPNPDSSTGKGVSFETE